MLRKIKNFRYCSQYSINLGKIKMIILKYYYALQYYIVGRIYGSIRSLSA